MTDSIDPLSPVSAERRRLARRRSDPTPAVGDVRGGLPMVIPEAAEPPAPRPADPAGPVAFAAQLMGQEGQKRGLRGGAPVLDAARSAYLGAEWTGPQDRRPRAGAVTKTRI